MTNLTPDAHDPNPQLAAISTPTAAITIPTVANNMPEGVQSQKLKRFRFNKQHDVELLRCVRTINAHVARWGKTEALYEEVKELFLKTVSSTVFEFSQQPSAKTLADRFKRLVSKRRDEVKLTSTVSGISEVYGEQEQLLDDLILEIDERDEAVKAEKEEQSEQERKLVDAGKDIREKALARKRGALADSEAGEDMGEESTKSSARKRRTARNTSLSDEEMAAGMLHQSRNRSELESKRLKLEQERIDIERERVERETERFDQMQETTNRRLDLDEKRFAVEVEERKQSLEERKKMIDVMSLLAKKLA